MEELIERQILAGFANCSTLVRTVRWIVFAEPLGLPILLVFAVMRCMLIQLEIVSCDEKWP